MRVVYVASDGEKFDTEEACLRHEREAPLFRAYGREGQPVEVGQGVHLLHIMDKDRGGEAFVRLCEERGEASGLINRHSGAGWYWWCDSRFLRVDEGLVLAMMRACHNIVITD